MSSKKGIGVKRKRYLKIALVAFIVATISFTIIMYDHEKNKYKFCKEESVLKAMMGKNFNLNSTDYDIIYSNCSFRENSFFQAKLKINGGLLFLSYNNLPCNLTEENCSVDICVVSYSDKTNSTYQEIKSAYCAGLLSKSYPDIEFCPGQYNFTGSDFLNKCLNGDYEEINQTIKMLKLRQVSNKCFNDVVKGDCLQK